jgi:hypothetical protein
LKWRGGGGQLALGSPDSSAQQTQANTTTGTDIPVWLPKNPKDLFMLWKECKFDLDGVKPVMDVSYHNKFSYCQCKAFWNAVNGLIAKGFTSDDADDCIYLAYGQGKSIGKILKLMAQDTRDIVD